MKKIVTVILLIILIIPICINAYELETESGYEYSSKIPQSGYSYSHTICNGTRVKEENAIFNEETNSIDIKGITEQSNCKFYFNKNGEEIINTRNVTIRVKTDTETEEIKQVNNGEDITFTLTPKEGYVNPKVTCTNSQTGTIENNTLTVSNVTNDTTCTVEYELLTYTVNATVLNGTIEGETSKTVNYKGNTTFTLNPTEGYGYPEVSCTNNQSANIINNTLTVSNVTNNTTCTVKYREPTGADTIIAKATEGNSEGLIKIDQPATGQTEALTEYRYSGSNDVVKNYVTFNNETWRIIGVFPTDDGTGNVENRIKIIREESIGDYPWDTSDSTINSGYGINQWGSSGSYEGADLMRLLNSGYESESVNNSLYWNRGSGTCYNERNNATTACDFSSTGLTENAKEMIDNAKWYTPASKYDITASESYAEERASTTPQSTDEGITVTRTTNWTGKVGLMYPSDYGYASSGCRNGEQTLYNYDNETCTSTNWLYNSDYYYQWLLAPLLTKYSYLVRDVYSFGTVGNNSAANDLGARPVIYLSSSVKITGGNGTLSSPYELEI